MRMRWLPAVLGLLCSPAALSAPEMIPERELDLVGRSAPAFTGQMLEGGDFALEDERGKKVVLSFWASWCGPCRQELPALAELQTQRDDVKIIAVNVDRNITMAKRFLAQVQFDLPIVWDNKAEAMGQYDVLSMPTMYLLDENLTVKFKKVGYSQANGLKELVAALDGEVPK